jgi:hypothetical protein
LQTLSAEVASYLGLELGKIKIKRFADGEIYVQVQVSWHTLLLHCLLAYWHWLTAVSFFSSTIQAQYAEAACCARLWQGAVPPVIRSHNPASHEAHPGHGCHRCHIRSHYLLLLL